MKTNILKILMLAGIATFILYSCGLTNGSITTLDNTICSNYSAATISELEVRLVHKMTDDYGSITGDSQSIWFDLETLKAFVYHIENEARLKKNIKSDQLGVRFYYSRYPVSNNWNAYPDLQSWANNNSNSTTYATHHTLIGVPTIQRGKDKQGNLLHYDFNPTDVKTYENSLGDTSVFGDLYLQDSSTPFSALFARQSSSSNTGAQNHGQLIPPADPTPSHFYNQ